MPDRDLPYGFDELDSNVQVHPDNPNVVKCFVRGCQHFVHRQTRDRKGELCPDHEIFCHLSGGTPTYSYRDERRNVIASPELFDDKIMGHPFKFDSKFLGHEKSEDTLSWNVFRSLHEANLLAGVANQLIGEDFAEEPDLYLWGIRASDDRFEPWDLLIQARAYFEDDLPVDRPLTEPDIALHLPGQYLVLIEAKFTSQNTFYTSGPQTKKGELTFDQLLDIYQFPEMRLLHDPEVARQKERVHYQLWRNTVFADWMARHDSPQTKPYHVNLVREGFEEHSEPEFQQLVRKEHAKQFRRATWEEIYRWLKLENLHPHLEKYFEQKSASLEKCFHTNRG